MGAKVKAETKPMRLFFCGKSGKNEWSNWRTKHKEYRCCKCGMSHGA